MLRSKRLAQVYLFFEHEFKCGFIQYEPKETFGEWDHQKLSLGVEQEGG